MNGPFTDVLTHAPGMGVPLPALPVPDELLRLYYALESLRPQDGAVMLQLVAASAGQGTSTIAAMLARIAAARLNQSVLLLSCNGLRHVGFSVLEAHRAGLPLKLGAARRAPDAAYWLAQIAPEGQRLPDLPAEQWREIFAALRRDFDITFLDSPAARAAPDAMALARYCDGTILIVQAESATAAAVLDMRQDIERVGGRIVGAVLNRERRHIPGWLQRWL